MRDDRQGSLQPERIHLSVLVATLAIGGAEQLLLDLLKGIDRNRFQVSLLFLSVPGPVGWELLRLGYPSTTHIAHRRFDLLSVFRLARLFRRERTDLLLLINHRNAIFLGTLAASLAGRVRVVNWQNETFRTYSGHRLTMVARRLFHPGISKVVAAAAGHKDYLIRYEKIPEEKLEVIYNAVDPARLHSSLSKEAAQERLGLPPGCLAISQVAVLRPDKAHDVLLKAAQLVVQQFPEAHFLIVGDGPRKTSLLELTRELGLDQHVHFLGFRRDMGDILRAVDLNVLASKPEQETLSVAVIEAMVAGIPTISSDVGFMREIVIPEKTGYLVKVGDQQELARRIMELLANPEMRRRMAEASRTLAFERLTIRQMTASFEKLFARLCTSS